jgi:predicted nuclease of predicted toxin-antitoxin system
MVPSIDLGASILFFVDEQLPIARFRTIAEPRGHRVAPVRLATADAEIIDDVERAGAVILTADHWFYTQLRRRPSRHAGRWILAGIVKVLGEWPAAERQLREWLPVIETAYRVLQFRDDKRLVIELRTSAIYIDT